MKTNKDVLVVAAHADDEVLGCGGTIINHISKGDKVHSIFMADGVSSRSKDLKKDLKRRKDASKLAQSILGISSSHYLNLPDNRMDSIPILNIIQKLEPIINKIKPSVVYTHHSCDLNIDHQITHAAVMTACRPTPETSVREIYGFEVLSSTEWSTSRKSIFKPTFFVNIKNQVSQKMKAIKAYDDEMRDPPHSRSIEHLEILAQHRGFSVGINMAEAFEVYRIIN
ncbi:PIG-L deacetylase family protein [Candidatus Pelagibacter bacterium nBUS_28]|uniref:PIG-L deacetylase family protein n=1 Tax=Candidatus Pelagibacter bacterium nBUS_28 TaxID=3374189 RepID=UPI003EBF05AC